MASNHLPLRSLPLSRTSTAPKSKLPQNLLNPLHSDHPDCRAKPKTLFGKMSARNMQANGGNMFADIPQKQENTPNDTPSA